MAASWPEMQQMVVHFPIAKDHPKITLRGLVARAKHWRDLTRLNLVLKISSRDLASLQRDIEDSQKNHDIKHIALADSWIDDDVNLTVFAHALPKFVLCECRFREAYGGMEPNNRSPALF